MFEIPPSENLAGSVAAGSKVTVARPDEPVLEVSDLTVTYSAPDGNITAVDGIGFDVGHGEVVGLVGESGSGKTSVATTLLGLHGPAATVRAGRLRLGDTDLTGLDEAGWRRIRGRRIALVPQHPMTSLSPLQPIGRQLDWYLGPDALERHEAQLRAIGLDAVLERPGDRPSEFSGGQLQRLVIAIATFDRDPQLLLADEPTSTLDVTVQAAVLEVLAEQRARLGTSMVLVSHDLAVVAEVCDRAVVMRRGHLIEEGPVEQLFAAPVHPYTRALVAAAVPNGRRPRPRTAGVSDPNAPADNAEPDRSASDSPAVGTSPASPEPPGPAPAVLDVAQLHHRFEGRRRGRLVTPDVLAVADVSVRVTEGDSLAIVGASGSGKTTLARAISGAIAPSSGEIRLDGRKLSPRRDLTDRRAIQLVAQNTRAALNPRRTIGHALEQAQRIHGIGADRSDRRERAADTLEQVGLRPAHLGRRPGRLSGGELARAVLARSLLLSPRLLILDEPTASLDAQVKQQVLEVIDRLRAELGLTVVVITHELAVARTVATSTVVMSDGRVVEEGPAEHVLREPSHPYTRALLASELQLGERHERVSAVSR